MKGYQSNDKYTRIGIIIVLIFLLSFAFKVPVVEGRGLEVIVSPEERTFRPLCFCLVIATANDVSTYPDENGLMRCTRDAAEACQTLSARNRTIIPADVCTKVIQAAEYDAAYGYVTDSILEVASGIDVDTNIIGESENYAHSSQCAYSAHLYALLANHCHPDCIAPGDAYPEHFNSPHTPYRPCESSETAYGSCKKRGCLQLINTIKKYNIIDYCVSLLYSYEEGKFNAYLNYLETSCAAMTTTLAANSTTSSLFSYDDSVFNETLWDESIFGGYTFDGKLQAFTSPRPNYGTLREDIVT